MFNVHITTIDQELTEKGIFFRWPLQKVMYDVWPYENDRKSIDGWYQQAKRNPFMRLPNLRAFKNIPKWFDSENFAGADVYAWCWPIYFKRKVQKAHHILYGHPTIEEIKVFGEEPYLNRCGGACIVEHATFYCTNGKKMKIKTYGQFHWYYTHIVEEWLKTQNTTISLKEESCSK